MNIDRYDSQTATLIRTCLEQQKTLDPKVLKTLAQLKKTATRKKDDALLGFTYFYYANVHYLMELNYDNFRTYLVKAISHLQKANEPALLGRAYNFIGVDACNMGSYDVAYHYFMMALHVAETNRTLEYLKGVINANIGMLYMRLGNDQMARQIIRMSIKQTVIDKDDIFYYHNLISCHYLDGVLSLRLGDVKGAERADQAIAKIEKEPIDPGVTGAQIVIHVLRAELAHTLGDRSLFAHHTNLLVESLHSIRLIFDFMEDISIFTRFLLDKKELPYVRRILDKISNDVYNSDSAQMKKIVTDIEIDYYTAAEDKEQTFRFLQKKHTLEKERAVERNGVYLFSIGLIDLMGESKKETTSKRRKKTH
ncbi:MAG: hypothetical protein IJQ12_09000 [Lachnospiraceae bacterium]|nr:hypothetical protein [Lachnospiraceae bacterium]